METEYPSWLVLLTAAVLFVMGLVVIYAAIAFINLDIDAGNWDGLDRVAAVFFSFFWGRFIAKSAGDIANNDAEQE